jgi:hypothetical protein
VIVVNTPGSFNERYANPAKKRRESEFFFNALSRLQLSLLFSAELVLSLRRINKLSEEEEERESSTLIS